MALQLQGASREAYSEAVSGFAPGPDGEQVAGELFGVADLLHGESALRRTLTDSGVSADRRTALVGQLFGSRVSAPVAQLLVRLVGSDWSRSIDIVDTLDALAVRAALSSAASRGELDDTEDQLFRFGRTVIANPALRAGLTNRGLPAERRMGLVDALVTGKVTGAAKLLVDQAVRSPRGRTLDEVLQSYAEAAADSRDRLLAQVRVAEPLTPAQSDRMRSTLSRLFDRDIELQVAVDPTVVGGVSVRIGDEVIDGTVSSRLDELRRRFAG